ncbi:histidine kinase [Halopseudomonas nanhaiensis]|uniref:histidine kinase n=1 Tax=Halopseudomonas nanhaiensis TaxID=2830842 RepID=UPI003C2E3FD9
MNKQARASTANNESGQLVPRHSIVFNTLVAFVVIISVTLLSMLGNLYMADALEGDAEAINQAGSLRMLTWRLATSAEYEPREVTERQLDRLEATLNSRTLETVLDRHGELEAIHEQIVRRWSQSLRPLLNEPADLARYRAEAPAFVEELDNLVHWLQRSSESKLEVVRALQVGTLFVIVVIAFILIYGLHNNLATPLRSLTQLARQIGRGNFAGSVEIPGDTELSLLARTLNQMNAELAELYGQMEQKVATKTARLRRSNESLQLLFDTARLLYSQADEPEVLMGQMLGEVQRILDVGPISLCLNRSAGVGSHTSMTSLGLSPPEYCKLPNCGDCPVNSEGSLLPSGNRLISFDLTAGDAELGNLRIEQPLQAPLEPWQSQLLETLADLFAASLSLAQMGQQQARFALMEERAVIARELHDSLAQALSAQKLQLARLKRQVSQGKNTDELMQTLGQVDHGLNAAYRQLRELLTTFRIKVDQPGLHPALMATVDEFSQHSGLEIHFDYQLEHAPLKPNEEVHCLQIVREALSNVVKHARACHCWLSFDQDAQGTIHVRIEDDGLGIDTVESPAGHYGLTILRERANSLNGTIRIGPRAGGGTLVYLRFPPAYRHIPLTQENVSHD